jgi:hypothetical protein
MVAIAVSNAIFTAVVAFAAWKTWKATRSYARITGVALLVEQLRYLLSEALGGAGTQAARRIAHVVKLEFPDLYEHLKNEFSKEDRDAIESMR